MIDWTNKDSLRRRGNMDVRAVEVHIIPEWIEVTYQCWVKWSDGSVNRYTEDGKYWLDKKACNLDVIPAPRSGEGWMREHGCGKGDFVIEPDKKHDGIEYRRVRWEEIE